MRIINSFTTVLRLAPVFFILIFFACSNSQNNKKPENRSKVAGNTFSVETFRLDSLNGWGYEIVTGQKVIIHQEFIPALEGNRVFLTREEALKVGNSVKEKLMNDRSPTLSKEEILSLLNNRE